MSGKEIAVYHNGNLDYWNVWGTDNVGKINANGNKFFYIKDHLGSIRVVLNSDNQIVSAIDYDCWGYPLENRSYQSDDINYKFTGKQRDAETGYDYFGARYYDARIANWGSVDPLLEKRIGWNPYNYVLRNPLVMIDPDGKIDVPKEYENQYSKLYSYMTNEFENIVTNDKYIMNAFMKTTGISEEDLRKNLVNGQGPKFKVKQLGKDPYSHSEILGHWDEKTYTIKVDVDLVNFLEESFGDAIDVYKFITMVTILHEGAHGAANTSGPPYSNKADPGYDFEKAAFYGIIISKYNEAVVVMNHRNYKNNVDKRYSKIIGGD